MIRIERPSGKVFQLDLLFRASKCGGGASTCLSSFVRDTRSPSSVADDYRTDMLYLTEVDRENALGLGKDVVLAGDVNADSFFVVMPKTGETLTLRGPYPLGFHSRHTSGRIDDEKAGWKGRGFWSSYSMYTPWHQEGGKGQRPKIVKFQVRPDPLAK